MIINYFELPLSDKTIFGKPIHTTQSFLAIHKYLNGMKEKAQLILINDVLNADESDWMRSDEFNALSNHLKSETGADLDGYFYELLEEMLKALKDSINKSSLREVTFKIPTSYIPKGLWKSTCNNDHTESFYISCKIGDQTHHFSYEPLNSEHFEYVTTNPTKFIVDIPQELSVFGLTPSDLLEFSNYDAVYGDTYTVVMDFNDKYYFILNSEDYEKYVTEMYRIKKLINDELNKLLILDEFNISSYDAIIAESSHGSYNKTQTFEYEHYDLISKIKGI